MPRLTKEREKYIRDNWKESPFITDLLEEIDDLRLNLDNVKMKTYAEVCIERAEKATEGPWHIGYVHEDETADIDGPNLEPIAEEVMPENCSFIVNARKDVPELARRLKAACEYLRAIDYRIGKICVADELEAIPREEK